MRKLFIVVSAIGLVLALAAPVGAAKKGPLKVATNLPAPGFWTGDTPDTITGGFEYELAKAIAKKLGYDGVQVVSVSFDALVAGQASGFDFALSQVTITKDRAKVVDFSTPYFLSDLGVLVNAGTKVTAKSAKNLQWGVQTATTSLDYLNNKLKPTKDPRVYQETSQAFAALQDKQVDAVLLDTAIVLQQAAASSGRFKVVAQYKSNESYGAIFPKGSKLRSKVDAVIKAFRADGTLGKLLKKNIGGDPAKIPVLKP